ncbi:MAG: zinc-binding dehydrogenase [Planctomycetota bacterium]|jgi:NADPH:quinone reductase-like Zn-dependent oxidoreductase|nr:zinc-binding dehydrogenase [Planctomycetota bacterium]
MQVAQFEAHGGPEVLKIVDRPTPEPAAGEVLVRMLAVSLNHLDLWARRGMPGLKLPMPFIPGSDGSGEVIACGAGVTGWTAGDRVLVLPGASSGESAFDRTGDDWLSDDYQVRGEHFDGLDRECLCVESRYLLALPEGLDPIQAAAVPLVFITAWGALVERAKLQAGETVLILGGSSGVGSAGIQIARDLGAHVITTAGTDKKREFCRSLGAHEVIDHYDSNWSKSVKSLTNGRGADVVFEHVGPATWASSMRSLARNGRLVTCGGTTGPEVSILLPHLFIKNQSVLGSTMGPVRAYPEILRKVAEGTYRPAIHEILPMTQIVTAHELLEAGQVVGKIVLIPGS